MTIIVKKFGGTSVATLQKIKKIARSIHHQVNLGNKLVIILSAMAEVTDQLYSWLSEIAPPDNDARSAEYDVVLATGEQVSVGLLVLYLQSMGVKARSWLAWQIPIITNEQYNNADIRNINIEVIENFLQNNDVAVIAGFQGVSDTGRITTLGRGGSDTTAVAIACALKVETCHIYTDVDGVYTADPRIVAKAHKLSHITYEEMLELAAMGAKIMHVKSIEIARNYNIKLQILSSFEDNIGTFITKGEDNMIPKSITGITYSKNESLVKIKGNEFSMTLAIFKLFSEKNINIDMIQYYSQNNTDLIFTVQNTQIELCRKTLAQLLKLHECCTIDTQIVKISIIGSGISDNSSIIYKLYFVLYEKKIDIISLTTTAIKISFIISADYFELAMRSIHNAFDLDK